MKCIPRKNDIIFFRHSYWTKNVTIKGRVISKHTNSSGRKTIVIWFNSGALISKFGEVSMDYNNVIISKIIRYNNQVKKEFIKYYDN